VRREGRDSRVVTAAWDVRMGFLRSGRSEHRPFPFCSGILYRQGSGHCVSRDVLGYPGWRASRDFWASLTDRPVAWSCQQEVVCRGGLSRADLVHSDPPFFPPGHSYQVFLPERSCWERRACLLKGALSVSSRRGQSFDPLPARDRCHLLDHTRLCRCPQPGWPPLRGWRLLPVHGGLGGRARGQGRKQADKKTVDAS
jgi:hypothetical protein